MRVGVIGFIGLLCSGESTVYHKGGQMQQRGNRARSSQASLSFFLSLSLLCLFFLPFARSLSLLFPVLYFTVKETMFSFSFDFYFCFMIFLLFLRDFFLFLRGGGFSIFLCLFSSSFQPQLNLCFTARQKTFLYSFLLPIR